MPIRTSAPIRYVLIHKALMPESKVSQKRRDLTADQVRDSSFGRLSGQMVRVAPYNPLIEIQPLFLATEPSAASEARANPALRARLIRRKEGWPTFRLLTEAWPNGLECVTSEMPQPVSFGRVPPEDRRRTGMPPIADPLRRAAKAEFLRSATAEMSVQPARSRDNSALAPSS